MSDLLSFMLMWAHLSSTHVCQACGPMICLQSLQARKGRQQALHQLEQMSGCTFQPNLNTQRRAASGRAMKMAHSMPSGQLRDALYSSNLFDSQGRPLQVAEVQLAAGSGTTAA